MEEKALKSKLNKLEDLNQSTLETRTSVINQERIDDNQLISIELESRLINYSPTKDLDPLGIRLR